MGNQLDLLQDLSMATPAAESSLDPVPGPASTKPAPTPSLTSIPEPTSKPSSVEIAPPASLLILDTETTGLEPECHACLEVGAILFDVASRSVLAQQSFLLPVEANAAEAINRIPAAVTRRPQPWSEGLVWFQHLVETSDVLVAHNAAFDRQWFGRGALPAVDRPWLCSMDDTVGPASVSCGRAPLCAIWRWPMGCRSGRLTGR